MSNDPVIPTDPEDGDELLEQDVKRRFFSSDNNSHVFRNTELRIPLQVRGASKDIADIYQFIFEVQNAFNLNQSRAITAILLSAASRGIDDLVKRDEKILGWVEAITEEARAGHLLKWTHEMHKLRKSGTPEDKIVKLMVANKAIEAYYHPAEVQEEEQAEYAEEIEDLPESDKALVKAFLSEGLADLKYGDLLSCLADALDISDPGSSSNRSGLRRKIERCCVGGINAGLPRGVYQLRPKYLKLATNFLAENGDVMNEASDIVSKRFDSESRENDEDTGEKD